MCANSIATSHWFLEALGACLIGDGRLTCAGEDILETYYSFAMSKNLAVSANYQFVAKPAYNSDRGPVHVLGGRVHVQF
jgi:high affinity Mn2+ porin